MVRRSNRHWRKPKYVKLYESHGQVYTYYRRGGVSFRIEGEVGTKPWFDRYEEIHRQFATSRGRSEPAPGSVDTFIVAYKKSDRYSVLADSTKEQYGYALAKLSKAIGAFPLASITRRAVVRLQDKIAETQPRNAIEVTKLLYLVFECACDLGEVDVNPRRMLKSRRPIRPASMKPGLTIRSRDFLRGSGLFGVEP